MRRDVQGAALLKHVCPVAWQHINLNGEYAFNKNRKAIDLAGLLSGVEPLQSE